MVVQNFQCAKHSIVPVSITGLAVGEIGENFSKQRFSDSLKMWHANAGTPARV